MSNLKQLFDPIHEFDYTKIGYIRKGIPRNHWVDNTNMSVVLSVGDSIIASTVIGSELLDQEIQNNDQNLEAGTPEQTEIRI